MNHSYRAYGLTFSSDHLIPGLFSETSSKAPDVIAELSANPQRWVRNAQTLPASVRGWNGRITQTVDSPYKLTEFGTGDFFELTYADGTKFVINGTGSRFWGTCPVPLTVDDLAIYLRGPVTGFLLQRRGITALHASAVCIAEQAVALCGQSQAGKSTTAAALALRGISILCDDIAALGQQQNRFCVEPGYPRVCLWPQAVRDLFGTPDALPKLTPTWEKCFLPLDGAMASFEAQRRPLGVIYILAERSEVNTPRVEEIGGREALLELVRNTYMNWLLDRKQRAAEFHHLSEIVGQVPVRRVIPHVHSSRIDELCNMITTDASALITGRRSIAVAPAR